MAAWEEVQACDLPRLLGWTAAQHVFGDTLLSCKDGVLTVLFRMREQALRARREHPEAVSTVLFWETKRYMAVEYEHWDSEEEPVGWGSHSERELQPVHPAACTEDRTEIRHAPPPEGWLERVRAALYGATSTLEPQGAAVRATGNESLASCISSGTVTAARLPADAA